jgi:hypothetical protein
MRTLLQSFSLGGGRRRRGAAAAAETRRKHPPTPPPRLLTVLNDGTKVQYMGGVAKDGPEEEGQAEEASWRCSISFPSTSRAHIRLPQEQELFWAGIRSHAADKPLA